MSDPLSQNQQYTLLADIGNSRVKYALLNNESELKVHSCQTLAQIPHDKNIKRIVFSSVKSDQLTKEMLDARFDAEAEVVWVKTQPQAFGIQCAYTNYENLGVDRWLALLGARTMTDLPVAVIDVGTAATCDIVVGQRHLGGWIAPGFNLMRNAVTANADRVFGNQVRPSELLLGTATEECVNMGCLSMLQGMIVQAERLLVRYGNTYRIFICGGDADLLQKISTEQQIAMQPNLVLEGLKRFVE